MVKGTHLALQEALLQRLVHHKALTRLRGLRGGERGEGLGGKRKGGTGLRAWLAWWSEHGNWERPHIKPHPLLPAPSPRRAWQASMQSSRVTLLREPNSAEPPATRKENESCKGCTVGEGVRERGCWGCGAGGRLGGATAGLPAARRSPPAGPSFMSQ